MRRRELLAGLGALGVFGAGGAVAYTELGFGGNDGVEGVEPVELQRFDAPGSPPGTERIPEPGQVTFLEVFATWCGICQRNMEPLSDAASRVDDNVQFVSVTNEPVGRTVQPEDVVEWFADLGGNWPVAHDEDLELSRRVDATGVPYSVVFDAENRIDSTHTGFEGADSVLERIESAQ